MPKKLTKKQIKKVNKNKKRIKSLKNYSLSNQK